MDLSTFQLVDAINDMDMLRNLSDQQQQHQQQQQQGQEQQQYHQHHQQNAAATANNNAYDQLHGDIDLLFQQSDQTNSSSPHINSFLPTTSSAYKNHHPSNQIMTSSPHYRSTPMQQQHHQTQNDCFDQEDILTPLISPAMTPSFSYQVQQQQKHHHHHTMYNANVTSGHHNEIDFSPLSSPAIMPQMDRPNTTTNKPSRTSFQEQLHSATTTNPTSTATHLAVTDPTQGARGGGSYKNMSANQIAEQYEQLEHAKLLINQKLSELQKSQRSNSSSSATTNYHDDTVGYQSSLLSESTTSSGITKDSNRHNAMLPPQQQQMNTNAISQHHHMMSNASKPSSPNQSPPHMEPATPASLMNLKMNTNNSSKLQFSSSGRTQQQQQQQQQQYYQKINYPPTSSVPSSNNVFNSPIMNTAPPNDMMSPMMTPTSQALPPSGHHQSTTISTPLSPLALQPRTTTKARSSSLKEKPTSSRLSKKQRRESSDTKSAANIHASPRALKPLLISPTLNPNIKPLPSTLSLAPAASSSSSSKNAAVHSVEDAERILATRSNYQNLMEGKGAALGIAFSTQIKSGLEVRRTAHKAAEQKRRDSLKEWFDRLRREVEDGYVKRQKTLMSQVIKAQELEKNNGGNSKKKEAGSNEEGGAGGGNEDEEENTTTVMKPLSKVLLLQYAYEYIASLKDTLQEKDKTIEKLKMSNGGDINVPESSNSQGLKRARQEQQEENQQQEEEAEDDEDDEDDEYDNDMMNRTL